MEEKEKKRRRRQTSPRKSQESEAQAAIRCPRLKHAERGCSTSKSRGPSFPHLQYKPRGATAVPLPGRYRLGPLAAALEQGSSQVAVPGRCMGRPFPAVLGADPAEGGRNWYLRKTLIGQKRVEAGEQRR